MDLDEDPPLFDRLADLDAWLVEYRQRPYAELGWIEALAERLPSGHVRKNPAGEDVEMAVAVALDLLWNVLQVVNLDGLTDTEALQRIRKIVAGMWPCTEIGGR